MAGSEEKDGHGHEGFEEEEGLSNGKGVEPSSRMEELLHKRIEAEEELKKLYYRYLAVMFLDVKGSTSFTYARGDVEGMVLVRKMQDIVFPIIDTHNAQLKKTAGDEVMSCYEDVSDCVSAAVEICKQLEEYNLGKKAHEQIHIRIGINAGECFFKGDDVSGDTINVSKHIESSAGTDQIRISQPIYDRILDRTDITCVYATTIEVKNREEPVKTYRLLWREEDIEEAQQERSAEYIPAEAPLVLEIASGDSLLRERLYEKSAESQETVTHYDEVPYVKGEINTLCEDILEFLNNANSKGILPKDIYSKLKETGKRLYDLLLSMEIRDKLGCSVTSHLILSIDENLVHIPWELFHDGNQFLCQRFSIGRTVITKQRVTQPKVHDEGHPISVAIVADPQGNLPAAYNEGVLLCDKLDMHRGDVKVDLFTSMVNKEQFKDQICDHHILHYAGHTDYDKENINRSGFLLSNGRFEASELKDLVGKKPLPHLIFSNSCQSVRTEEWRVEKDGEEVIFGLANALLLCGVRHFIGSLWKITDKPSSYFAEEFYNSLLKGNTIGRALLDGRKAVIKRFGENNVIWASYILYGDPTHRYFPSSEHGAVQTTGEEKLRGVETDAALRIKGRDRLKHVYVAVGIAAAALLVLWAVFGRGGGPLSILSEKQTPYQLGYEKAMNGQYMEAERLFQSYLPKGETEAASGYEGLAYIAFKQGDYQKALEHIEKSLNLDPQNSYAHVILGNIAFNRGDTTEAEKEYRLAITKSHAEQWQLAEAYNRLGRIYAAGKKPEDALKSYDKALELRSDYAEAMVNKGVLVERSGKVGDAIALYKKATMVNPDDEYAKLVLAQSSQLKETSGDRERQERIDRLVEELSNIYKEKREAELVGKPRDPWTSLPMTIYLLPFQESGSMPARDGFYQVMNRQLSVMLGGSGRVSMVERELLEKLLKELKLSSSDLADPAVALRLGRLVSARYLLSGAIIKAEDSMQVFMNLIETETSRVGLSISKTYENPESGVSGLVDDLAGELLGKIKSSYPIRGRITSIGDEGMIINVGSRAGVTLGMKLKVFKGAEGGKWRREIGTLVVVDVTEENSLTRAEGKVTAINVDFLVEELLN